MDLGPTRDRTGWEGTAASAAVTNGGNDRFHWKIEANGLGKDQVERLEEIIRMVMMRSSSCASERQRSSPLDGSSCWKRGQANAWVLSLAGCGAGEAS